MFSYPTIPIAFDDPTYPTLLRDLPGAPRVLYCRGNLDLFVNDSAAVIGSRETTPHACALARQFGECLADEGWSVVSGLARGIDTAGHTGILDVGGLTIAVLVDVEYIYPRENQALADRILANCGLLVSEHPPGVSRSSSFQFKRALFDRDRIQAGLSRVVIAVQCGKPSGTLHTVGFAEKYQRPVFVPRISKDEYNSAPQRYAGTVDLIRSGRGIPFIPDQLAQTISALGE